MHVIWEIPCNKVKYNFSVTFSTLVPVYSNSLWMDLEDQLELKKREISQRCAFCESD